MLFLILPWGLLLFWSLYAVRLPCQAVLGIAAVTSLALSLSFFESSVLRRRALAYAYLQKQSFLARWLTRRLWVALWSMIKGCALALILLLEASTWEAWIWKFLLFDALFLYLIWHAISRWKSIKPAYRRAIARKISLFLNTILGGALLTAGYFYFPHADYRQYELKPLIQYQVAQVKSECQRITPFLRWQVIKETVLWHSIQRYSDQFSGYWKLMLWLPFLALSSFFIWLYTRLVLSFTLGKSDLSSLVN